MVDRWPSHPLTGGTPMFPYARGSDSHSFVLGARIGCPSWAKPGVTSLILEPPKLLRPHVCSLWDLALV